MKEKFTSSKTYSNLPCAHRQWKHDGHDYQIHLAKLTVTGGRGTNQTKDQELSWLLVLSGIQYGLDPSDKESFISGLISNSEIYGKVDGQTSGI